MRLNTKRTLSVGFAFFLICAFWQAYDTIVPKTLVDKFGMSQTASGAVMAIDNVLALFLLPLFGSISDKLTSRMGRRTPFILFGTIASCALLVALSFADSAQLTSLGAAGVIDDPAGLTAIYETLAEEPLKTGDGESYTLAEQYTRESFAAIRERTANGEANEEYTKYVVPARQAYAAWRTSQNRVPLYSFMAILLLLLIAMAVFRSPAVALMPDVTVKPLRSKANAVINLMGSAGGILVLLLGTALATGAARNAMMRYTGFFSIVAGVMLISLGIFLLTVREQRFEEEMRAQSKALGIEDESGSDGAKSALSGPQKRSLVFLLGSIVLWFMGYNAVSSKYSVYAGKVLNLDYNLTLLLAQGAAICAYLPVGMVATRFGRRKTILTGIAMLTTAFVVASFLREGSPALLMNCMFALAGIGWATINVNSFPMVVELARDSNIGKYTGYYYTASMAAQIATPMLSGVLLDNIGLTTLFPYAAVFTALSFLTMRNVRHGDSRPERKQGLESFGDD